MAKLAASGIEQDAPEKSGEGARREGAPAKELTVKSQHLLLTQAILQDQTDGHNELASERQWLLHPSEKGLSLCGNAFSVEDSFSGCGRLFVKRAPLPHARPASCEFDLRVSPVEGGFRFELFESGAVDAGSWNVIEYSGGFPGRVAALQRWQRSLRPSTEAQRVPKFLCNTWGDRSRDSRIQEGFVLREIEAAKRIGAEVVQIDDGWQRGVSANSSLAAAKGGVWEGFWNNDPCFWEPHPERFPRGLAPVVEAAKAAGVEIGLWFAPDSWNEFSNWGKDAARLLSLHREFGIRHFKVDGVMARTEAAHANLQSFFSALREGSKGEIAIDLDITAQVRPGYYGAIPEGPLFVENRYSDWHNYWPHQTLRNLWKLSAWVDPARLRMELLNNSRNADKYQGDPLAPALYAPETLFAMTMFSNPLGWFEISNLPESYYSGLPALVALWKQIREELFSGAIMPFGDAPDGLAWTGLMSLSEDGSKGYAAVFRELSESSKEALRLPGVQAKLFDWKVIAGQGDAEPHGDSLLAEIPGKLGFVLLKFSKKS